MKPKKFNMVLFNAVGLGLLLFVGGYMLNSAMQRETVERCSARYGDGQQFALLKSDGTALSPIEMQARLPSREWGLLTNSRVVVDKSAGFLQVALGATPEATPASDSTDPADGAPSRDGVGFVWEPQNLKGAQAACLSYRVYFSKDFAFNTRGTLPGLYAVPQLAKLDGAVLESGFASRLAWDKSGFIGLSLKTPVSAGSWLQARTTSWPTNRWAHVEQEVVLNHAGKSDGLLRVWIDGELKIEAKGINLGGQEDVALSGVVVDVGYAEKVKDRGRVTLSPFIVQNQ